MAFKGRKTSNKNPPFFSHEFVIQNHADIVSCVALIFVIGLMVQATSPIAYMFIALHHNVTTDRPVPPETPFVYTYGWKDTCTIFFYTLICIVMHGIIQEYVLDKISRKLHLSKVKHSKFNESGQLLVFYVMSVLWGGDVIFKENMLFNIPSLWEGYPHGQMVFMFKFFFIIQIAYWLHCYPELYFQKTKKEEMPARIQYATLGVLAVSAAYLLNFNRVGLCLIVIHYISETFYHIARLIDFVDKEEKGSKVSYLVSQGVFVACRLGSIILSVIVFWHGLCLVPSKGLNVDTGDFNTPAVRLAALASVCILQVYLMFNFITEALQRYRESSASSILKKQAPLVPAKPKVIKKKVEGKQREYDELTEVDQNTKKSLKQRNPKVK